MEIIQLNETNFETTVQRTAEILARGGIVVYPTDTLYGLAVDAFNRPALEQLRILKGREKKKPISLVLPSIESIDEHAELSGDARRFAMKHLPGALTLVLPGKAHVPNEVMLNGYVGIRVPNDRFALALAQTFSNPYTATSANRSGFLTPPTIPEIMHQLGSYIAQVDLVIDAGPRSGVISSTVLTFKDGVPYILREGALSKEELGL